MICSHPSTAPVTLSGTGDIVALLCRECLEQLPLNWGCLECEWADLECVAVIGPVKTVCTRVCFMHQVAMSGKVFA